MLYKLSQLMAVTVWSLILIGNTATGDENNPFDCKISTAVTYNPSVNWSVRDKWGTEHDQYIYELMKQKHISVAGPVTVPTPENIADFKEWKFQNATGGLLIFETESVKEITELIENDPFIKNKVTSPSFKSWLKCGLK